MSKSNYKRLGDYIREVNVRNRDLAVTRLVGLSIDKIFIPSVANTIGTDMSTYKIIRKGQFACSLMQVSRDGKIPVAMLTEKEAIMSPAYPMFEVVDKTILLPEYLMMWFSRSEFDREASFYAVGGVRGSLTWEDFCDMTLPIPDIAEQQRIVAEYEALCRRIAINEQICTKLEETATALYRKMFVDNIDKENLPDGWRMGKFTDVIKLSGGGTPSTNQPLYWSNEILFFTPADISFSYYSMKTEKHISKLGLDNCSSKLYPVNTIFISARGTVGAIALAGKNMAMNQSCYAINPDQNKYIFYVHQLTLHIMNHLKEEAVGAVFNALVTKDFETLDIVNPKDEYKLKFNDKAEVLYSQIYVITEEINKLKELQSLLLAKIVRK